MRAGTVHSGEETAQGDLVRVYKYLMGEGKMLGTYSSQWCTNWNRKFCPGRRNLFGFSKDNSTLVWVA